MSSVFVQQLVQAQIKENIKALRHWPLWFTSEFLVQKASDVENASIWRCNRGFFLSSKCFFCRPLEAPGQIQRWRLFKPDRKYFRQPSLTLVGFVYFHHAVSRPPPCPLRCNTNTRISAKEPLSAVYFLMSLWLLANILHNSCPTSPVCDSANPVRTRRNTELTLIQGPAYPLSLS